MDRSLDALWHETGALRRECAALRAQLEALVGGLAGLEVKVEKVLKDVPLTMRDAAPVERVARAIFDVVRREDEMPPAADWTWYVAEARAAIRAIHAESAHAAESPLP